MITDNRLKEIKKEILVSEGNDYINITKSFFKISSNFPNGWCNVKFFKEFTKAYMGWVNQNGEYLKINGKTKFDWCGEFNNGLAWVKIGSNEYLINTLGFGFNTNDRTTAEKWNENFLKILNKDFPENSMKHYLLEKFL